MGNFVSSSTYRKCLVKVPRSVGGIVVMRYLKESIIIALVPTIAIAKGKTNRVGNDKRPNVLIVINDDQSYQHTGYAGCKYVNTPGFDRVAGNGLFFTHCYAGSPGSAPSRSTLVTGRHHWQNKQAGQHASSWMKDVIPVVDFMDAAGYATGYTGKGVDPFLYAQSEKDSMWRESNAAGKPYNNILYTKVKNDERTALGISNINYFENFKAFIEQKDSLHPFFFWVGMKEPHRSYEKDSWKRNNKTLEIVNVPPFLPDNNIVRGDLLDYIVEIEWADRHLVKILNYLDSIGELDKTLIIVTADNGMPFPAAKANCFEAGIHVPMAISYPPLIKRGRRVDDMIGFVDIVPTILELTGVNIGNMPQLCGKSLMKIFKSEIDGKVEKNRRWVFAGRERHSSSRWNNLGYPQRAIVGERYLFIWNMKHNRWPAGAPQTIDVKTGKLNPMFGIDEQGRHHSDWAFTDVDASPTKSFILEHKDEKEVKPYYELAFCKRPVFELYDLIDDPNCKKNLAFMDDYKKIRKIMYKNLLKELKESKDSRVVGPNKEIFDEYRRYLGQERFFPQHEEDQ